MRSWSSPLLPSQRLIRACHGEANHHQTCCTDAWRDAEQRLGGRSTGWRRWEGVVLASGGRLPRWAFSAPKPLTPIPRLVQTLLGDCIGVAVALRVVGLSSSQVPCACTRDERGGTAPLRDGYDGTGATTL